MCLRTSLCTDTQHSYGRIAMGNKGRAPTPPPPHPRKNENSFQMTFEITHTNKINTCTTQKVVKLMEMIYQH